jgi:hypothetical protein
LRLFYIGGYLYAFTVDSATLDSRADGNMKLTPVEPPAKLAGSMCKLAARMGLDYCAADFKTCPRRGLIFLEINTMPVYTGYDDTIEGRLSDAILLTLTRKS